MRLLEGTHQETFQLLLSVTLIPQCDASYYCSGTTPPLPLPATAPPSSPGRARSSRSTGGARSGSSTGVPVAATVNCADNAGAKNFYIISVKGTEARLNQLPSACVGDMDMATVKRGKSDLRKKEHVDVLRKRRASAASFIPA
ncbi:hypothetical protein AAG906_038676 [Vitis piasezkii]